MKTSQHYLKNISLLVALALLMSACADVTPVEECVYGDPYGFLGGLWHGIIAPISFVGSLFFDDIAMYAVNNNGGWYDFGFVLGAGILSFGSHKARR